MIFQSARMAFVPVVKNSLLTEGRILNVFKQCCHVIQDYCTFTRELSEVEYERRSEETLITLSEYLDTLPDQVECDSVYDISYSMGVLTAHISSRIGTYVINKQTPNKQIWLSSPISGPKRSHISTTLATLENGCISMMELCFMNCWRENFDTFLTMIEFLSKIFYKNSFPVVKISLTIRRKFNMIFMLISLFYLTNLTSSPFLQFLLMFSGRPSLTSHISPHFCRWCRPLFAGNATAAAAQPSNDYLMKAWTVDAFHTPLLLSDVPMPTIRDDRQLIIRVKAASVNPIDVRMMEGYGAEVLTKMKCLSQSVAGLTQSNRANILRAAQQFGRTPPMMDESGQFPLILGRDCSGEVVAKGRAVDNFDVGDQVIAVVPPHCQGTHAEYTLSFRSAVAPKPSSLSHTEAAALPYVACTAWAALVTTARINPKNVGHLRVLIHGGSGGVGTMAIQMLRCWGVEKVVATCSAENMKLVEQLGAKAVDYRAKEVKEQLIAEGPFEVILDCANTELAQWSDELLGIWRFCVHVSVNSPLLRDTDRYGLPMGIVSTGLKLLNRNLRPLLKGCCALPAFFAPNSDCLHWVTESVERGQLRPVINKVFPSSELPKAYEKVGKQHGSGKTVIDFDEMRRTTDAV